MSPNAPSSDDGGRTPAWSAPDAAAPDASAARPYAPPAGTEPAAGPVDLSKQPSAPDPLQAPPGWGGAAPPPVSRPVVGDRRGVVPLRPLGLGELLDGAVAVVRGYPRPVFVLGAVVAAAGALLELVLLLTLLRPALDVDPATAGNLAAVSDEIALALVGLVLTGLFSTASALVLTGLVAPAVSRGTLAQPLALREAWAQVRPRLGALVAVAVLVTSAVVLALLLGVLLTAAAVAAVGGAVGALVGLLAVPGSAVLAVHLYVRWGLAPLCVVLERQGVRQALRRSGVLVRTSWWRVFGILLLAGLIAGAVGQVLQAPFLLLTGSPFEVLSGADTSTSAVVVTSLGALVAAAVVGPFDAAVRGLLYVDRRMRSEGLDVALAAAHRP